MDDYSFSPCFRALYRQPNTGNQAAYPYIGQSQFQGMPTYPLPAIGTTYPTGLPAGPAPGPMPIGPGFPPAAQPAQVQNLPSGEIGPITTMDTAYVPGYLKSQIGRKVRVEFLIGTNGNTDRTGTLVGVGASYILLRLEETDDIMLCDLYSIKFVTFYY